MHAINRAEIAGCETLPKSVNVGGYLLFRIAYEHVFRSIQLTAVFHLERIPFHSDRLTLPCSSDTTPVFRRQRPFVVLYAPTWPTLPNLAVFQQIDTRVDLDNVHARTKR